MTVRVRDELDQRLRDLRAEAIPRRYPDKPPPRTSAGEQLEHFLTLAQAVGGMNRHDIAHLRARGYSVTDDGEVSP